MDLRPSEAMFAGGPAEQLAEPSLGGSIELAPMTIPGSAHLIARDLRPNQGPLVAAVFDTGADALIVHPELARSLALPACAPWRIGTLGGATDVMRGFLESLTHGGHRERQLVVTVLEPPWIPQLPTDQQPGLIWGGEDLLAASPVLDFAAGRLRFRGAAATPLAGEHIVRVPLHRRRAGRPLHDLEINLGGKTLRVLLDTGSAPTLRITKHGLHALGLPDTPEPWIARGDVFATSVAGAAGENAVEYVARFPDVSVGKLRFVKPLVHLVFDERVGADGAGFDGLLGAGALSVFARVGLDSVHGQIEFDPGEGVTIDADGVLVVPAPPDWPGLFLTSSLASTPSGRNRYPMIAAVAPGSPAAQRGLQADSVVLAIDGEDCAGHSAADVNRRFWLAPGASVELRVRDADGSERSVRLP